jgi:hypothetical protein
MRAAALSAVGGSTDARQQHQLNSTPRRQECGKSDENSTHSRKTPLLGKARWVTGAQITAAMTYIRKR